MLFRSQSEDLFIFGDDEGDDGRHGDEHDAGDDADEPAVAPAAPAPKSPLTKAGQASLAKLKTQGLRARLRLPQPAPDWETLVALLILAVHAKNVKISGYQEPNPASSLDYRERFAFNGGIDHISTFR